MDFTTWLSDRGGKVHPELDLFHTLPSGDRGVVARRDISEGELLLLLPTNCAIYLPTDEEFNRHPDKYPDAVRYLREAHAGLSPFLATTMALMSEMTRGPNSPLAPYVATLPLTCPNCLLNWTEEEKAELAGTSLEQQGPDPAKDAFRRHVAPILAARGDLWPGLSSEVTTDGAAAVEQVSEERGTGLSTFVRAAALVQSRAFHLEAENWVSGSSEMTRLDGGGTQVFLLPGIDMINHSHNPDRRNAHLQRLDPAQVAAAKLLGESPEEGARVEAAGVEAYFVMRADKSIKAGEEVLHTYGNLSDTQLLQTYGFLDSEDSFRVQVAAAAAGGPSPKKRSKSEDSGEQAASGGSRNPYNAALVPWLIVEEVCNGLLKSMDQAPPRSLKRAKRDFLAATDVLQSAAPDETQFVLLAQEPLSDELSTAVQVLLMTKDEFYELQREIGGKAARGGIKGKATERQGAGAAASSATAKTLPKLSLGTSLLEEDQDFAEMVCIASLQVLEAAMERYPTSVSDDVRLLRSSTCNGRLRLAVRARLGEKDVLQLAKKAVVERMKMLRDGAPADAKGGQEADEDDDEDETMDSESEGKEEVEAKGRRRGSKRQRHGLGASPYRERSEGEGGVEGQEKGIGGGSGDEDKDDEDELLLGSDDSEKVGYGAVEYDDGIGEAHDRGKAHNVPQDD